MKFRKTSGMATIIHNVGGSRTAIYRRIYENGDGREYVKVNGEWFDIMHYCCDNHFEVHRY